MCGGYVIIENPGVFKHRGSLISRDRKTGVRTRYDDVKLDRQKHFPSSLEKCPSHTGRVVFPSTRNQPESSLLPPYTTLTNLDIGAVDAGPESI